MVTVSVVCWGNLCEFCNVEANSSTVTFSKFLWLFCYSLLYSYFKKSFLKESMILWIEMGSRGSLSVFKRVVKKRSCRTQSWITHFYFTKGEYYRSWYFPYDKKLSILCYLADIFGKTNTKLSLQGKIDMLINKCESICFSEKLTV